VRTHYAPALARANTALQRYAQERPNETTLRGLRQAARTLDAAGREVRAIAAPPDAAGVRRALIRLYDLEAALARDVATTAAFSPQAERVLAPLKPATAQFNRHAKTDRTSETQAVALATYAAKLRMTAYRVATLEPPRVLARWQYELRNRLRSTAATCARLAQALRAGDAASTRVLTRRLRTQLHQRLGIATAQQAALRAFNARLAAVVRASRAVDEERAAVEQAFG
jgi:hypothetical protein